MCFQGSTKEAGGYLSSFLNPVAIPLWFVVLIWRPGDGRVRSWSEGDEETLRSALPRAWSTALFSIKFVVADPVLRDQATPAEEIHTWRIIWKDKKHLAHRLRLLTFLLRWGPVEQRPRPTHTALFFHVFCPWYTRTLLGQGSDAKRDCVCWQNLNEGLC